MKRIGCFAATVNLYASAHYEINTTNESPSSDRNNGLN